MIFFFPGSDQFTETYWKLVQKHYFYVPTLFQIALYSETHTDVN